MSLGTRFVSCSTETVEKGLKPTLVTEAAKAAQTQKKRAAAARAAELELGEKSA